MEPKALGARLKALIRCPYFKDDLKILAAVLSVVVGCKFALHMIGVTTIGQESWWLNAELYLSVFVLVLIAEVFWLLAVRRPKRPIRPCLFYLRKRHCVASVPRALPLLAAVIIFLCLFSVMKSSIPLFHPYQWDSILISTDRIIHGGDPWRLLHPLLGYPVVTAAIGQLYQIWILLLYAGTMYMALYVTELDLRRRYFVSFFSIWFIIGVVLATCFSSVGPCFVGRIFGNPYYEDQITYLRMANEHFPIGVLKVQDKLAQWKTTSSHTLGAGISAMPSMHVAMAFLFFLAIRKVSRKAGWFFGAFFIAILVGSVHLGYHYAVDGYVSIFVTLLIWKVAGMWPAHRPTEAVTKGNPASVPMGA